MTKNNIALIGMMGSGKTTVAKELKNVLADYALIDVDEEIEKTSGKKISEIFNEEGEQYFRTLETEKVKFFTCLNNQIISLGGGAFENEINRKIIKENCLTIYLKTSAEEIFRRIKSETHRPLLAKNFSLQKIEEILTKREKNYEQAHIIIDTDNKTPYDVVVAILGVLKK